MAAERPVDVLLWDCDGVLQHNDRDWVPVLDEVGGSGFAQRVFAAERPAVRGEESLRTSLTRAIEEHEAQTGQRVGTGVEQLLAMWETTRLDPDAVAVLQAVRGRAIGCYLATNQQDHRVRHMREVMGYDALVDGAYYSSEMGVMKPEAAFFGRILADLALSPDRVGFVDDSFANVQAAQALGIRAVRHDPGSGASGLVRDLEAIVPGLATVSARTRPGR